MSAAISSRDEFSADGWLCTAEHRYSPNFDDRPTDISVELLVIHAISLPAGQFTSGGPASANTAANSAVSDLFLNQLDVAAHPGLEDLLGVRVSAHFFIQRDGRLIQFVATDRRAWHAGISRFMDRERCNDFSIGIEMEGSDFVPFEAAQYDTLARLTDSICRHHPIRHIVGHLDIAPVRKTDPGPFFDWVMYQNLLQQRAPSVFANAAIRFRSAC